MPVSQSENLRALTEVVETGLAKAYRLRGEPLGELPGLPPLEEMEMPHRIYYYLTPNGAEVQQSEVDWPFDGQGNIRKDWLLPTE
jgi:hypothetical protein